MTYEMRSCEVYEKHFSNRSRMWVFGRSTCVMCEPYPLSLERSREHGTAVNCADRCNIAVVKVLSPAERVSSASAVPRSMVRLLPFGWDSLPPDRSLWTLLLSMTRWRPFVCGARAFFRTGTTSGDGIDVGNKIRSPARAALIHILYT